MSGIYKEMGVTMVVNVPWESEEKAMQKEQKSRQKSLKAIQKRLSTMSVVKKFQEAFMYGSCCDYCKKNAETSLRLYRDYDSLSRWWKHQEEKAMQEKLEPMQKVTTIADTTDLSEYWAERQRIAYDKQEARITRVAIILKEFLKLANSKEYWDGSRSGRGWVRMWARKIVQAM